MTLDTSQPSDMTPAAGQSSGMATEDFVNRMFSMYAGLQARVIELPGTIADSVDMKVSTRLEAYMRRWDANLRRMQDDMHADVQRLDARIDTGFAEHDALATRVATLASAVLVDTAAPVMDFQPQFDTLAASLRATMQMWFMFALLLLLVVLIAGGLIFVR